MLGIMVTLIFLAASIAIAVGIYRGVYGRRIARGGEGNLFAGLVIWAATCLGLGFAYAGLEIATGIEMPEPFPMVPIFCEDGSLSRIDGTCPCSRFDLRIRC